MLRPEDLEELADSGLIVDGATRLPKGEMEPQPWPGSASCSLPMSTVVSPFLRILFWDFLNFFGAQLHHFSPNTITYLTAFVSMCENFLGCRPHWGLLKHIFTIRSQSVKKANSSD